LALYEADANNFFRFYGEGRLVVCTVCVCVWKTESALRKEPKRRIPFLMTFPSSSFSKKKQKFPLPTRKLVAAEAKGVMGFDCG
jgi:hypothetical protein